MPFKKGVATPGAGRPKGRKSDTTFEKEKVNDAIKQRIFRIAGSLLNAQESLAKGTQMLYKIHTDSKGKRGKPELVTDEEEIAAYIDGEYGEGESLNSDTDYYFITAQLPNNQAIDSMFNRALGKPSESVDVTSGGKSIIAIPSELMTKNDKTDSGSK